MSEALALRAASIAANALNEMRRAVGRDDQRPTDADMALQFEISKVLSRIGIDVKTQPDRVEFDNTTTKIGP